jgi:hypothetical protein
MYSRARSTNSIACGSCSPLYAFRGSSINHTGWFTLLAEEQQKVTLMKAASALAKPIQARLVPQVQQAIGKLGATAKKWHPMAIKLLGASDDLEEFRKAVRYYGNLSSWISNRVTPDRFQQLATALGDTALLPLVQQYAEASEKAQSFVVQRIDMVAV